jgi:hypothetical protein
LRHDAQLLTPPHHSRRHHHSPPDIAQPGFIHNMANSDMEKEEERIESHVQNLKLEGAAEVKEETNGTSRVKAERNADTYDSLTPALGASPIKKTKSSTQSPIKSPSTPSEMMESTVGGEITVKQEPGQAPKLARTASQKIVSRPPPLYLDEPDKYEEATKTFEVITECNYATKWLGETEHAMECDCRESWGKSHRTSSSTPSHIDAIIS